VSADGDDLEVIDLASPTTTPATRGGRQPRVPRGPVAVVVGGIMLAAATLGVALAHHSHDRRTKTAETIVLPTGTGLPPTSATSTPTTTTIVSPDAEFIAQIGVISPGVGWALNGLALYRTIDDTATWTNMTPPGVTDALAHIRVLDFLDADHAWLAVALDNQPPTIDRTSDGGRSWDAIRPDACGSTAAAGDACGTPVAIDFIDRTRGWAVFSSNDTSGTLLATHDAGTTWTVIGPTPFVGMVHFTDASTAWGTGGNGALYRTTDGAKTWRPVTVPADTPDATVSAIGAPQFFGRDVVVATRLTLRRTRPPVLTVYSSRDGGVTWTAQPAPADPGVNVVNDVEYRFSAATPSDWALLFGTRLWLTHDAGRHWARITPTTGLLAEIHLTAPYSAWLLAPPANCTTPLDGCANTLLLHTTDGGRVWVSGSPTLGVTANRLP
jgi:photosystem II stability/assembly factor-like uncharacterized protein